MAVLGLSDGQERTITQILTNAGIIDNEDLNDKKGKGISNYYYWATKPNMNDIFIISNRKLRLSPKGHLLGEIFKINKTV